MEKQLVLFIVGCITVRIAISIIVGILPDKPLRYLAGPLLMLPAIGFSVIYIFGLRNTGAETMGKPLWWNHMRPIHATLYFMAAILAMGGKNQAAIPLAADVAVGAIASAMHYI